MNLMRKLSREQNVLPARLIEDLSLYPRNSVDDMHVRSLAQAIASGAELPDLIAEKETGRIVDGFHRCRAYERMKHPVAAVQWWHYDNKAEMIQHAVSLNSTHGLHLSEADKRRAVVLLKDNGLNTESIAATLHVTPSRVLKLFTEVAYVGGSTVAINAETREVVPLKRSVLSLAGRELSWQEVEAVRSAPGTTYALIVRQLSDALRLGFIDRGDEKIMDALVALRGLIDEFLSR
jgi:hypothetical protein